MKKTNKAWLLLMLCLMLVLAACSSDEKDSSEGTDNGTEEKDYTKLTIAYNAQPPTIDPVVTTAVAARDIARNVFESLLTFDKDYKVVPMLAESFEESEDGKVITFNLRKDVKFHDGSDMTADDVVSSMERWKTTSGTGKSYFANATFEKVDDSTVRLVMPERLQIAQYLLADTGQIAIITKKEINESTPKEGLTEYIGTGPYKFVEWKSDQYVHLEKFEDYSVDSRPASGLSGKKEANFENVYFEFVTDASTRFAGIQTGEYDLANAIPFDNAEQLKANEDLKMSVDHNGFNGIVFNKKARFFTSKEARQAVNAALDQEAILTAAFSGADYYELESGLMIASQKDWYTEAGADQYNQKDEAKAKELLQAAGYKGEEIIILATRDYEDHYNAAVVVQQQLEKLGMNAKLDIYDWPTVQQRRTDESAYDIFVTGFPTEQVPNNYVFLDSKAGWAGWTNSPEIDVLLDEIAKADSQEAAKDAYSKLMVEFYDYLPMIKFGNKTTITAYDKNLDGYDFLTGFIIWNLK